MLLLSAQQIGPWLLWQAMRWEAQREMASRIKNRLAASQKICLRLPTSIQTQPEHFHWEDDHEFWYQGAMYDLVAPQAIRGDTMVLHCVRDWKETRLYRSFQQQVNRHLQLPAQEQRSARLLSMVLLLYLIPETDFFKHPPAHGWLRASMYGPDMRPQWVPQTTVPPPRRS